MTLTYDFDMFDVIPETGHEDERLDGFLTGIGFNAPSGTRQVALFRDARTADALRNAPPALRDFFLASGFGLNTYSSGAPQGRYPLKDEDARLEVISRMTEYAETHPLPRAEDYPEGGDVFRLGEFLLALTQSEPIEMPEVARRDHDRLGAEAFSTLKVTGLPPVFEGDPLPMEVADLPVKEPGRKFWQNRFFRVAIAAGLVLGVVQLASGPARMVLASL